MNNKKEHEYCCLCGYASKNLRYAYRGPNTTVTKDGFYPRNSFTWEEIKRMVEKAYNAVCSGREACFKRQNKYF